jgi:sterol 3beta-glucosyltransferase
MSAKQITILAAGSRGDVQPYVALGKALQDTGQRVKVVTFENFAPLVRSQGLDFAPVRGDIASVAAGMAQDGMGADNPLRVMLNFNKLKNLAINLQSDFFAACEGSDAVVYHPGAAIGYFIAQERQIPGILASPFPMTPTGDYPALIFYNTIRLGRQYNRLTHKLFEQVMWFAASAGVGEIWRQQFGRAPKKFGSPFARQVTRRYPTVISCSNFVFARPDDYPDHVQHTGYWFLDEEPDWKPSPELMDFLQAGSPPVYVGFGSLSSAGQAAQTTQLAITALERAGQRGILATGWNGMEKLDDLPGHVLMLEGAPHAWLFPRLAAAVHHGGAGTTAAGLRAGVPSILIPHSNDQFAWGRRVYELGVGAQPIPRTKLNAENLAEAIRFALTDPVRRQAKELGLKIQEENGAARAAEIIAEALV